MSIVHCQSCEKPMDVDGSGDFICPHCSADHHYDVEGASESMNADGGRMPPPWENERSFGGFFATIKQLIVEPFQFFQTLKICPKMGTPLLFGVICGSAGVILQSIYRMFFDFLTAGATAAGGGEWEAIAVFLASPIFSIITAFLSPLLSLMGIFVGAAINQFFLWVVRSPNKGFEATVQVVAYTQGIQLLQILPFFGPFVAGFWQLFLLAVGLKEVHESSYARVIMVICLPSLICCCLFVGLFLLISGGAFFLQ